MLNHSGGPGDLEQTDVSVPRGTGDVVLVDSLGSPALHRHLHVGLAGCEPNLPDDYVVKYYRLAI